MRKNLLHALQLVLNSESESDANQSIAKFLLGELAAKEVTSISIYDVSEKCFTSNSTVSRFVKKLGYNSFPDLKEDMENYQNYGMELVMENQEGMQFNLVSDHEILQGYIDSIAESLESMKHLDIKEMDALAALVYEAEHVYLFGTQISGLLAKHAQLLLAGMGKISYCYDDSRYHSDGSKLVRQKDLAIIFSSDGNYISGNKQVIVNLKQKGAKMVLVTQNPTCKFISQFDSVFFMGSYVTSKGGPYKLLMFIEVLINRYAIHYFQ